MIQNKATEVDRSEVQKILAWADDPVLFVIECLGVNAKTIEPFQMEGLRALVKHNRVAIRSGHGVGKTTLLAWSILWWLLCHYPARVACTANTAPQLEQVLWAEIDKWHRKMPKGFHKMLEIKSDMVVFLGDPKQCYAVAKVARKEQPEAFQGQHSENMLFLIDEASGVDDIIFEMGRGSMSSEGAKTLMAGNPTRTQGYFYDAFHGMRRFWHCIHVPCSASRRVSAQYIEECKEEYGEDSNSYRVRVLGEFPVEGDDIVIPLHLIESAISRGVERIPSDEVWGLDVARFGDDRTAMAKRAGNYLVEPVKWWSGKDAMQVVGIVKNEYDNAKVKPAMIYVDAIGIGAGVADRLSELKLPVVGVNVSESPAIGEKFARLRDELWWSAREWFRRLDVKIPDDKRLMSELCTPTYNFTSGGKVKVESKDDMKKRTTKLGKASGRSPDLADAFCLTFGPGSLKVFKSQPLKYPSLGIV